MYGYYNKLFQAYLNTPNVPSYSPTQKGSLPSKEYEPEVPQVMVSFPSSGVVLSEQKSFILVP